MCTLLYAGTPDSPGLCTAPALCTDPALRLDAQTAGGLGTHRAAVARPFTPEPLPVRCLCEVGCQVGQPLRLPQPPP